MSDRLPAVTGKQVIKALEAKGWYLKRIRGSHHIMRPPTIPNAITGPGARQPERKVGTLGNILRTAGPSLSEFRELS